MPEEKNKVGRPRKEIDFTELEKLCALQCLETEIAGWFECSVDTLSRRVEEKTGLRFAEYFAQKRGNGKIALRRQQMQMAMKGNPTMLVWLGKQYLNQKDKQEIEHSGAIDLSILTDEELDAKIAELEGKRAGSNA